MSSPGIPTPPPEDALAALADLEASMGPVLPAGTQFGVGLKQTAGAYTEAISLIVFVPEKLPAERIAEGQAIPRSWPAEHGTLSTDVIQSNPKRIGVVNDTAFYPILQGGVEIGWEERPEPHVVSRHQGTLGCTVRRRADGRLLALTAHHVASLGETISQPQPERPTAVEMGTVVAGVTHLAPPGLDCSAVDPTGFLRPLAATILDVGAVTGSAVGQLWDGVRKRGRTTGLTTGTVVAYIPNSLYYGVPRLVVDTFPFSGLFCWEGDSGSAVVNASNEVIGLLLEKDMATTDDQGNPLTARGLVLPISIALDALGVDVAV